MMRWIIMVALFVVSSSARGEDVKFSARTDRNEYKIGEWVELEITVQVPPTFESISPLQSDSLGGFEVLHVDARLPRRDGDLQQLAWSFRLIAFDTGRVFIPPIPFTYRLRGDTTQRLAYSRAVALMITGVEVDLQGEIRDIKSPLDAPWLFEDFLPYILLLLAILLAAGLLFYWRKRQRRGLEPRPVVPVMPPHETALAALRELEDAKLWQQGKTKEYYSRATEIIRRYLEGRFGIPALESTSDEILRTMGGLDHARGTMQVLSRFLLTADLVKFAKYVPTLEENTDELAQAYMIVRSTMKPVHTQTEVGAMEDVHAG